MQTERQDKNSGLEALACQGELLQSAGAATAEMIQGKVKKKAIQKNKEEERRRSQ